MKTIIRSLLCLSILLSVVSCSESGKYERQGDIVCYTYWTFSFGRLYDTLPGVDASTFQAVNDWLGHDHKSAYYKDKRVDNVDVATIKAVRYPLFRDKKDYYYQNRPLGVADMKGFKILKWSDDDMWAVDAKYAYYDSLRFEVDIPSFKVKAWNCAVDKNHVYRYGRILPLADPATYVEDWKDLYSRDKNHIWYCGDLLEDVDYATFTVDKDGKARDARGPFRGAVRDSSAVEP